MGRWGPSLAGSPPAAGERAGRGPGRGGQGGPGRDVRNVRDAERCGRGGRMGQSSATCRGAHPPAPRQVLEKGARPQRLTPSPGLGFRRGHRAAGSLCPARQACPKFPCRPGALAHCPRAMSLLF